MGKLKELEDKKKKLEAELKELKELEAKYIKLCGTSINNFPGYRKVKCPKCHAKPEKLCKSASGRTTDHIHMARVKAGEPIYNDYQKKISDAQNNLSDNRYEQSVVYNEIVAIDKKIKEVNLEEAISKNIKIVGDQGSFLIIGAEPHIWKIKGLTNISGVKINQEVPMSYEFFESLMNKGINVSLYSSDSLNIHGRM